MPLQKQVGTGWNVQNQTIAFFLLLMIAWLTWQLLRENNIARKAVYTVGLVTRTGTTKSGFLLRSPINLITMNTRARSGLFMGHKV
jgi:hypothetical protein